MWFSDIGVSHVQYWKDISISVWVLDVCVCQALDLSPPPPLFFSLLVLSCFHDPFDVLEDVFLLFSQKENLICVQCMVSSFSGVFEMMDFC